MDPDPSSVPSREKVSTYEMPFLLLEKRETHSYLLGCVCVCVCVCVVGGRSANEARKVSDPMRDSQRVFITRQDSALSLLHGDNRDSGWRRAVPLCHSTLVLRANPLKAEGQPGPAPAQPRWPRSCVYSSPHTGGKGAAEAGVSARFLEIINLCPSPSSLFLPHFFPPG